VIAVVDYGAGNLTSVLKGLRAAGGEPTVTASADDLSNAAAVVIPGVGHFATTQALDAPMRQALLAFAAGGRPVLGICLGLQFLFEGSTEAPGVPGLGLLDGECTLLPSPAGLKVPHVGWNSLTVRGTSALLGDLGDGAQVYFTHSYAAPVTDATVATTDHGIPFAAVVERGNVFGVQFHPEKSSEAGLRVLRQFVQISKFPHSQISRSC
jgi:glutamine amidotransferase